MIIVLGGGPAGRTAAIQLALNGEEVTLIEKGEWGAVSPPWVHDGLCLKRRSTGTWECPEPP